MRKNSAILRRADGDRRSGKTIELPEEVHTSIQKGECAGRVVYKADGEELGSVAILYGADVARAGMWDLFGCTMKQYFLGTA